MDCWKPVRIYNKGYANVIKALTNLDKVQDNPLLTDDYYPIYLDKDIQNLREHYELLLELTPEYIYAPCRKCPPCLKKRSNEWNGRLIREVEYWFRQNKKVLFCTLSYKNVRGARKHYKKDLALFFDRMRSKYRRSIRHWCIPELGEKNGRFHIHALLFDCSDDFAPDSHFHRSKNGAVMGSNSIIKKLWSKGIVDVGFLKEVKGASYMVTYLTKITESSLRANDGIPFKGGIVCSNKLGYLDYDEKEMFELARLGKTPIYKIGNYSFAYSYSLLRKYLNPLKLRYISFINSLKRDSSGGQWIFHKQYYSSYSEYKEKIESTIRGTYYSKVLDDQPDWKNSIIENKNFYFEDLI